MTWGQISRREVLGAIGGLAGTSLAGCVALEQPSANESSDEAAGGWQQAVYEKTASALLEVRRSGPVGNSGGSGFFLNQRTIVTNAHVVGGNDEVHVRDRKLEWGTATVVERDVYTDLAVLKPNGMDGPVNTLPWASGLPEIGEHVMALGAPLGFEGSASTGIVSGVNRALPSPTGFAIAASIQVDAAVNPGSSGGPLLNRNGEIVGVVFAESGENVGFAIAAEVAKRVIPTLAAGETVEHAFVGIAHRDVSPQIARANDLSPARGVYVDQVLDDAPASGLIQGSDGTTSIHGQDVPVGGDIILEVDGHPTPTGDHLGAYLLLNTKPGDTVRFGVHRDDDRRTVDLVLGTRPPPNEFTP